MKSTDIVANNLTYTVMEGGKEKDILKGIDCSIPKGMLTTISGPSGSGKTTFMYTLAGLSEGVKGEVNYGDVSLYSLATSERDKFRLNHISFIFQHLNLFGFMNVEDNIRLNYILRNEKVSREVEEKIDAYMDIMKLGKVRKKEIQTLSGGEKQRIAIIRAFISGAKYIFADEPTGNLDRENSYLFMDCMKDIMKENDATVVLVTHDSHIFDYGDNRLIIEDGKINK